MNSHDKNLRRYFQHLRIEKNLTQNTIAAYAMDLEKWLQYVDATEKDYLNVCLDDFHNFAACISDLGISSRSLARILSGVRSFYRFLTIDGILPSDPTELLENPTLPQHLPEVLTVEEIDSMIEAVDCSTDEGHRNRAILEVLYSCGLRVSELCDLKMSGLYLDEGYIRVMGKGRKERLVPISPRAVNEMRDWFACRNLMRIKEGSEDFVFISHRRGTSLGRHMVFRIVRAQAAAVGITKTISPHTFRHSFATHLLEGGANLVAIQAMLGHAYIGTTEIYLHIDRSRLRDEILLHHPREQFCRAEALKAARGERIR